MSRRKQKCRFGPGIGRAAGHASHHLDQMTDLTGQTHRHQTQNQTQRTSGEVRGRNTLPVPCRWNPLGPLIENPPGLPPIGPSRVTLMPPMRSYPLDRYRKAPVAPPPSSHKPYWTAQQRLGISEEELDAQIAAEVNEILPRLRAESRWEAITASSSKESPRILTKEDCRDLFTATGVPPPGALMGVYRWAFDEEEDEEPLSPAPLEA